MNEELQQALVHVINSAVNAKEFIVQQTPEVIQQLLLWHGVSGFLMFIFGVVWCAVIVVVSKKRIKKAVDSVFYGGDVFMHYIGYLLALMALFVVAIPGLCLINFEWLQIWLAPKVWLIEYASNLIK